MNEAGNVILIIVSVLIGMLMAFGMVLLFTFFGSSEDCRTAVYSYISTII